MMQTIIDWRPWPEQKPPRADNLTVRCVDGSICAMDYNTHFDGWGDTLDEARDRLFNEIVTHFALPEDIHTGEKP